MKKTKLFKTIEDVRRFRQDLEDSTEDKFIKIDEAKRKSEMKAREILLD